MDPASAVLDPRKRAIADFAIALTLSPTEAKHEDLQPLRAQGLSDEEILVLTHVVGFFNHINRVADALGVEQQVRHLPLWPMLAIATAMEAPLRPLGIQPPLHRRRMHFFIKAFQFSGEQARSLLGYEARVDFRDGIERTAKWYREHALL